MSCSCSRRRSVWSSKTRTAEPGSAMGMAVRSSVRSPARISAVLADGSAMARATGSDQAGGRGEGGRRAGGGGGRAGGRPGRAGRRLLGCVGGDGGRPGRQRERQGGGGGGGGKGGRVVGPPQPVGVGVSGRENVCVRVVF